LNDFESKLNGRPEFLPEASYLNRLPTEPLVEVARAHLPTNFGEFDIIGFYAPATKSELTALVKGSLSGGTDVPFRMHSQCHTGDILGSLRCDCQSQLHSAMEYIERQGRGVVLYLPQEGRGIGLLNKIKAYHLQDLGLNTVEANEFLGYPADTREYGVVPEILRLLGIESVALLTNNPEKVTALRQARVQMTRRIPLIVPENRHNSAYLATKRSLLGHLF